MSGDSASNSRGSRTARSDGRVGFNSADRVPGTQRSHIIPKEIFNNEIFADFFADLRSMEYPDVSVVRTFGTD